MSEYFLKIRFNKKKVNFIEIKTIFIIFIVSICVAAIYISFKMKKQYDFLF